MIGETTMILKLMTLSKLTLWKKLNVNFVSFKKAYLGEIKLGHLAWHIPSLKRRTKKRTKTRCA